MSKFGRRGIGQYLTAKRPIPALPTIAPPGSPEKIRILMERAECGWELWHPRDAAFDTGLRPLRRAA
jgi:hypothetical protein